tara:strand:+ start:394 stop:1626 length:1233 start_codon:yes stop_codon:yes gene_type:complete
MINKLNQRWNWYQNTITARNTEGAPREIKAFSAEDDVAEFAKCHPNVIKVFQGIRILDPDRRRGAGEIDCIIVTTRGVIGIETKNWGWEIIKHNEDVAQKKLVESDSHKPVLPHIQNKVKHLSRWLRSLTGNAELDVFPMVVLAHPKCTPSQEVKKMRHVCKTKKLHQAIDMLQAGSQELPESQLSQITKTIEIFGRYDKVTYDGGQFIAGDFVSIPLEFTREKVQSIDISIVGGKLLSFIRGPRLLLKITNWDGEVETRIIRPNGLSLTINEPWGGKSSIRLEHLKEIRFGNQGREMEMQLNPINRLDDNNTTFIKETDLDSCEQNSCTNFTVGMILQNRTVLSHLQNDGRTHSLLVEIVPKAQKGLLSTSHLSDINPEFFNALYAVGQGIDVKILKIKDDGRIVLGLP